MNPLEQIQQDIQTLPQEALTLLAEFIQLLKKHFTPPLGQSHPTPPPAPSFLESAQDFIGCLEGGPGDLATNKQYLDSLGQPRNADPHE